MSNLFFYCKFVKLQLRLIYFLADYVQTGYGAFSKITIGVVKFCSLRLWNHNFRPQYLRDDFDQTWYGSLLQVICSNYSRGSFNHYVYKIQLYLRSISNKYCCIICSYTILYFNFRKQECSMFSLCKPISIK